MCFDPTVIDVVLNGTIDYKSPLVRAMAWHKIGDVKQWTKHYVESLGNKGLDTSFQLGHR